MNLKRILYIFFDEGGNLDFSGGGTKHFVLTSLSKERPFEVFRHLNELKYNLIELGVEIEYFHATEDRQAVRNSVFEIINSHLDQTRIDSLTVEKKKILTHLQADDHFYPQLLADLLVEVMKGYDLSLFEQVIVFTDSLPVQRKRKTVEKAIKKTLAAKLPPGTRYSIFHHSSKSNYDLQIVDYCNWAIYRKNESGDARSYEVIKRVIKTERVL